MIEVWFNERGYFIQGSKGESTYVYDLPEHISTDASALYTFRWIVLNQALEQIEFLYDEEQDKELILNTDSRLVEEIQGDITPENSFARACLQYFIVFDASKFRRYDCRKCSASAVNNRLQLNGTSNPS
jgi:hypothetical protein